MKNLIMIIFAPVLAMLGLATFGFTLLALFFGAMLWGTLIVINEVYERWRL